MPQPSSPNLPGTRPLASLLHILAVAAAMLSMGVSPAQEPEKDPALEPYFIANGAYNRKLYPVAITQYEVFLAKHPDHAKADLARQGLALSQYALKQYEKALPQLTALLAKEKLDQQINRERIIMLKGQCFLLTGKKDEARALFVAEIDQLKAGAYRTGALAVICDVSFGKSEWAEVLAWSGKLLAAKPTAEQAARGLYQRGYAHYQLKKPDEAIASLGKIAALEANKLWSTRADYLLGECYNLRKEYDKAEASFLAAQPGLTGDDATECRYRLGLTRFVLKKYKEAIADLGGYLKDAKESPRTAEAKLYIARSHLELDDFGKAAPLLTQLAAGEGENAARANRWLSRLHTRQNGDYDQAAEILAKAVTTFADSTIVDELRFDYANALMARSEPDWKTALDLLLALKTAATFSQMADVLGQSAVCQHKLGDYKASLASNEAFLAAHGDSALAADARFMRAENLFLLNRLDEATKAYEKFTASHADHGNAQAAAFRLAQVHHDQGRWEPCLAIATPMLAQKPEGRLFAQLPFIVGDCHFRQGKWAESLPGLEAFLATRVLPGGDKKVSVKPGPNVDTALMQLAIAHDRLDQQDQALKDLAILTGAYPEPTAQLPLALAEQGRLAFEKNNLNLARKALERFLAEDKKDAEPFKNGAPAQRARVFYYLGWVESSEEKQEEAAKHFGMVAKVDPKHALAPDAALQQGIAWVNSGNFEAAAKHFPAMLKQYPKHEKLPRLVYYAGLALARQKQWDQALVHFKRIAEKFADSEFADQALYEWAWCDRRSKREKEAIVRYEKLLADHPASPLAVKVQSELAELNLESGAEDKVIAQLTATLEKVKDEKLRADIRYQLASAHFKKGDHKTAATRFEALLKDYPDSALLASILFQAGESRLKLGETITARDHFAAANIVKGGAASLKESITMRLAETQALTSQHGEAKTTYASFIKLFPESRWARNARFGLAFATENGGASANAIPEYKKLLDDPKVDLWTVRSRFQTGECLFNLQKYEEAVTEFVNVEINYTKYPAWQAKSVLEIGRVLIAQKKNEQAAERLKDVIRRFPKEKAALVAQQYLDELRTK
jgi:TolA-binding protein